jgi:putative DNA methylase
MSRTLTPYSLKDAPALIEKLLPVQKLSAEVFKERKAGPGQTLVPLGAYWKGRKPLILNKACILGCLLPATDDLARDLEIFEKLMAMDDESFAVRWPRRQKPQNIIGTLSIAIRDYFNVEPESALPKFGPVDWSLRQYENVKATWRDDITELGRRRLEAQMLPKTTYRERVEIARRPEEAMDTVHEHIWDAVNGHLGTRAQSFPELVEQLGIMRFGHRPRMADTFCGSGQIPFEGARLGCDIYASDLNPVACMISWGAFNIIGREPENRLKLATEQKRIADKVQAQMDHLGVESDGQGWRAKAFLYCLEARCPQTDWTVPLLPSRIISLGKKTVAELIPDFSTRRYNIVVRSNVSDEEMAAATNGTVRSDGRGQDPYMVHTVDGREYRTKISTLRGDFRKPDGSTGNKLRLWEKTDFKPRSDDIFQERLYAVHWMRPQEKGKKFDYEFRSVTEGDLKREQIVERYVGQHLAEWQEKGWVPDMQIEAGAKTDEPIRTRGWTHWHHLFPPRHLLFLGLMRREVSHGETLLLFSRILDYTSKLCRWTTSKAGSSKTGGGARTGGASDNPSNVFYNQALNTFYNYGCRGSYPLLQLFRGNLPASPADGSSTISCRPAAELDKGNDFFVTDPPYGDAVNYEEILDFFIAWLRKNPSLDFSNWVWDSRRSLAIKGEGEDFRRGMVAAYKRMTECMPDNGIQVIMFTHQLGSIWADMANIVWASGLQVTAAWYVVTETESALRAGSYVKGTVLLVVRKRRGLLKTTRDDLAWEIQEEVEEQVKTLTGLNQDAKGLYRDENVFEDADIQMAGYAAALRVLTRYAIIDGRNMPAEAIRPRIKGEQTLVDDLITFAVDTANQCLVPEGIAQPKWDKLLGAERFYLKMLDLEARGAKKLDNYQNFAKAFKVRDFKPFMASQKANEARLRNAVEFGRTEMNESSELYQSALRAVLYALMELVNEVDGTEVLVHLTLNVPNYYGDMTQRELVIELADYLAKKLEALRPEEAAAARVLRELVKNQRLG